MIKRLDSGQSGFTIIELLIATTVFSLVLLLATYALLHIGNTYSKATKSIATQDTARSVIENLSKAIQFNGTPIPPPNSPLTTGNMYCFSIGSVRYTFVYNQQLTNAPTSHGLVWDDSNTPCPAGPVSWPSKPYTELLGKRMRITKLSIAPVRGNLYILKVRVIYGDDDLITGDNCKSGAGSQFCAAAELSTVIQKRI